MPRYMNIVVAPQRRRRRGGSSIDFATKLLAAKPITTIENLGRSLGIKVPGKFGRVLGKFADFGKKFGLGIRRKSARRVVRRPVYKRQKLLLV